MYDKKIICQCQKFGVNLFYKRSLQCQRRDVIPLIIFLEKLCQLDQSYYFPALVGSIDQFSAELKSCQKISFLCSEKTHFKNLEQVPPAFVVIMSLLQTILKSEFTLCQIRLLELHNLQKYHISHTLLLLTTHQNDYFITNLLSCCNHSILSTLDQHSLHFCCIILGMLLGKHLIALTSLQLTTPTYYDGTYYSCPIPEIIKLQKKFGTLVGCAKLAGWV